MVERPLGRDTPWTDQMRTALPPQTRGFGHPIWAYKVVEPPPWDTWVVWYLISAECG
jgi:hypothetical protein